MKGKKKMLKRFVVKNYKNFRDEIVFDFGNIAGYQFNQDCLYGNLISKAIIYGRNATGKSNLGNAVLDIAYTLRGIPRFKSERAFINADSTEELPMLGHKARISCLENFPILSVTHALTMS